MRFSIFVFTLLFSLSSFSSYSLLERGDWDFTPLKEHLKKRVSFSMGYNFADTLESKVSSSGETQVIRDPKAQGAFSFGTQYRFLALDNGIHFQVGLQFETPRNFSKYQNLKGAGSSFSRDSKIMLWQWQLQAHLPLTYEIDSFAGINYSLPLLSSNPGSMSGDMGFLAGVNFNLSSHWQVEGIYKITNVDYGLEGRRFDMSIAGLEILGRYRF